MAGRLRSLAVGLAVLLVVALAATTLALVQRSDADRQATRANEAATFARATQLATLARTLPSKQTELALLLGVEGRRLQPSLATDGGLEAAITHRPPHLERVLPFATPARYPGVSDDGRLLAAPGNDGNIRIYDLVTGQVIRTLLGDGNPAFIAAFNHDASLVVSGSQEGKVTVWRVATGKPVGPRLVVGGKLVYGTFDRAGALFTVSDNGTVERWDLRDPEHPVPNGEPFTVILAGTNDVPVATLGGADGQLLAVGGSASQTTTIWDVATHRRVLDLVGTPGSFSPDGSILATTSGKQVLLSDVVTGAERGRLDLKTHDVSPSPPTFSPDGRRLAAADVEDNAIHVFDVVAGSEIVAPLVLHRAFAAPSVFLPGGRLVTTGANEAVVWQLETPATPLETILPGNRGGPVGTESGSIAQFTPDGAEVITVGFADHRVLAFDAVSGAPHGDLLGGRIVTEGIVAFSPDGKVIAAAGNDGSFTLWNRADERMLAHVDTGRETGLVGVAWVPHRPILVTAGAPGRVLFWDVSNPRHPVEQRRRALTTLAGFPSFSADGRFLVVVGPPPTPSATVFDVATGHKLATLGGHSTLPGVAFTPDSTTLATAAFDLANGGKVELWDTTTWHRRATLILPYSPAGLAFFDGGARFVTPSILQTAGRIDLWDTATLQPVGEPLAAPTNGSIFATANERGTKIAIGSYSGTTTVLDVDPRVGAYRVPPRGPQPHPHRMGPVPPRPGVPHDLPRMARRSLTGSTSALAV